MNTTKAKLKNIISYESSALTGSDKAVGDYIVQSIITFTVFTPVLTSSTSQSSSFAKGLAKKLYVKIPTFCTIKKYTYSCEL